MKTEIKKPSYEVLCEAAELIKKGEVVAIPTETVYGLAADAYNPEACEKIFKAKGRPQDNPLPIRQAEGLIQLRSECPITRIL